MNRKTVKLVALIIGIIFILGLVVPLFYIFVYSEPAEELTEETVNENIKKADEEILNLTKSTEESKKQIEASEKLLEKKLNESGERFRIMCEKGNMSYMDVIFSSKSLSDLIDRTVIAREFSEYDKNVIVSIKKMKKQLSDEVSENERLLRELKEKKENLEFIKKSLKNNRNSDTEVMTE